MEIFALIMVFSSFYSVMHCQCFYTGTCYIMQDKGLSYRGNANISHSGRECVPWNRHLHYVTTGRYPYDNLDKNFCRNPREIRSSPWCYTSASGNEDESWEFCDIPVCDGCLFRGLSMREGDRFHDGCSLCICGTAGLKCLECPEAPMTDKMGCYIKYNNNEGFPKCCPSEVCHGRDAGFDIQEYFNYLRAVLEVENYDFDKNNGHTSTRLVPSNATRASSLIILP